MSTSTNLTLPFLTLGQAQKHVTINESLLRLDALVQLNVVSATISAQPGSPSDGAVYILPSGKTGADWAGMSNAALAYYRDGIWEQISPREGWLAFVRDSDQLFYYTGAAWSLFPSGKILSVSATDKVIGRVTAGAGAAEEVAFTDQAQQLCDDTSFAAMLTTLGAVAKAGDTMTGNLGVTLSQSAMTGVSATNTSTNAVAVAGLTAVSNAGTASFLACSAANAFFPNKLYVNWSGTGGIAYDSASHNFSSGGIVVGSPTGGHKGAGTVNATALYDDNTLLTCFVLEYARTGALDLAFWDSAAPRGRHDAAHRFWGQRELLDVDAYTAFWKENGHLPGLPSREEWAEHARDKKPVGEMISRLWQTVEMQAVHIGALRNEIVALKNRVEA